MTVLDSYVTIGKEAAYGTVAAALTRGLEVDTDPVKRTTEHLTWNGMRPGYQGTRVGRSRPVQLGAAGDLNLPLMDSGLGMLLEAMIGTPVITAGTPTEMVFSTSSAGPTSSLSVQSARGTIAGATVPATGLGGMVASWEISQKIGGEDAFAMVKASMDYQREVTSVAAASAVFPSPSWLYAWPECKVEINGAGCVMDVTLTGDNKLRTDRRCLNGNGDGAKEKPYRNGVPVFGGTFSTDYADDTLNDLYRLGTTVEVKVTWTASGGKKVIATMAAAQLKGDSPVVSLGGSTQSVSFTGLDNGTAPIFKLEYFTADVAV